MTAEPGDVRTRFAFVAFLVACLGITACAAPNAARRAPATDGAVQAALASQATDSESARDIDALAAAIRSLGPGVDPDEAARAARVAYAEVAYLRGVYQITDPAIVHNMKVNAGTRPRGLCWHWAEDMEKRLAAENFQTLDLHRAIANYDNWRLEHSTVIIGAAGASMFDGVVLDPWRKGGNLTWMPVRSDHRYDWTPRAEVFEWKRVRGLLTTTYIKTAGG